MSDQKKFAFAPVNIHSAYLTTLKALEYEAYQWGLATHGLRPRYNNPVSRLLTRDLQRQALDKYFNAIEKLIPQKSDKEPA